MNRAVGRVGEGLLRLTQLPHYKDSESFQDFKGFREESPLQFILGLLFLSVMSVSVSSGPRLLAPLMRVCRRPPAYSAQPPVLRVRQTGPSNSISRRALKMSSFFISPSLFVQPFWYTSAAQILLNDPRRLNYMRRASHYLWKVKVPTRCGRLASGSVKFAICNSPDSMASVRRTCRRGGHLG